MQDKQKNENEEKTLNNWQVNHNLEANATWTLTKHTLTYEQQEWEQSENEFTCKLQ
jgi:hypothetical protein